MPNVLPIIKKASVKTEAEFAVWRFALPKPAGQFSKLNSGVLR